MCPACPAFSVAVNWAVWCEGAGTLPRRPYHPAPTSLAPSVPCSCSLSPVERRGREERAHSWCLGSSWWLVLTAEPRDAHPCRPRAACRWLCTCPWCPGSRGAVAQLPQLNAPLLVCGGDVRGGRRGCCCWARARSLPGRRARQYSCCELVTAHGRPCCWDCGVPGSLGLEGQGQWVLLRPRAAPAEAEQAGRFTLVPGGAWRCLARHFIGECVGCVG